MLEKSMKKGHCLWAWGVLGALAAPAACTSAAPRPTYAVADRGGDRDQDGAADVDDACPDAPEDGLPPKANDGCPASDPDQDGVAYAEDKCPDAKEDGAAASPNDGCPASGGGDEDGDGVVDASDKCPGKFEDNLPPSPSDGCPAPDADNDRIADARDRCPNEPESINEYRDQDGCPDQAPGGVLWDDESSSVYLPAAKRFQFAHDSAELTPEAKATIAEVAAILKERQDISRVEIEGHASTQGATPYNASLTEERAQAVGRALVQAGVVESRLVPIGYGEHCLAVQTEDGVDEPKNRRVLLKTVQVAGVWRDVPRGCWQAQAAGINPTTRKPGVRAPAPVKKDVVPRTGPD